MQSAPNCNKDDNEFDDDHESCHGLSPPFFYNYLRLFFAFVADGFGEVWAGILPPGERNVYPVYPAHISPPTQE